MEFPAIERLRNIRKCNIFESRERDSLGKNMVCSVLWEVTRTVKRLEFTCRFILGPHLANGRFRFMILSECLVGKARARALVPTQISCPPNFFPQEGFFF